MKSILIISSVFLTTGAIASDFGLNAPNPPIIFKLKKALEVNQTESPYGLYFVDGQLADEASAKKASLSCLLHTFSNVRDQIKLEAGVTYVSEKATHETLLIRNPRNGNEEPKGGIFKFRFTDASSEVKGVVCTKRDGVFSKSKGLNFADLWKSFGSYASITESPNVPSLSEASLAPRLQRTSPVAIEKAPMARIQTICGVAYMNAGNVALIGNDREALITLATQGGDQSLAEQADSFLQDRDESGEQGMQNKGRYCVNVRLNSQASPVAIVGAYRIESVKEFCGTRAGTAGNVMLVTKDGTPVITLATQGGDQSLAEQAESFLSASDSDQDPGMQNGLSYCVHAKLDTQGTPTTILGAFRH